MNGNLDWNLMLTALGIILTFCTVVIAYYRGVHVPKQKSKEEKREQLYKPLLKSINAVIEQVKQKKSLVLPFNWKTVEGKVSTHLFRRLQKFFDEKVDNYYELLKHNQNFIRFKGYYYLNSHLPELQKEYLSLGVGGLEFELYETIVIAILEGEKLSLRWLEDRKPDLYEHLTKCPKYKKINDLFDWLNEESPSVISLRKAEQDLLQSAEEMKAELKKF